MNTKTETISEQKTIFGIDIKDLRQAISQEYEAVAQTPDKGFHFHTGRRLAAIVEYQPEWLEGIPESVIDSFAGTGNPFSVGTIVPGESVIDIGCGAGIDSFIAAKKVGPTGRVIGVDMTEAMLDKARKARESMGYSQLHFEHGIMEDLPIADNWGDVIISNGVVNLAPDKERVLQEMHRVLKPEGRLQIADILVQKKVPESAKRKIDLWTG
jgi:arsenite methyltransferase